MNDSLAFVRRTPLVLALSFALPTFAAAAENTINVTASHGAPVAFAGVPSIVIDRAEIDRLQATSVLALLENRAGLNLTNLGGAGQPTSISLWGQNASQTLVLVDGVRIGSLTVGTAYLENLPLSLIERIEIIKGPRSGQYGADAMGGVIQIFTRRGTDGMQPSFSLGGGSNHTFKTAANLSGRRGAVDYSIGASHDGTGGFNAYTDTTGSPYAVNQPDNDGYRNNSAQWRLGYTGEQGARISAHWLGTHAFNDYDGSSYGGNQRQSNQQTFGVDGALAKIGLWQLRASAGRNIDRQTNYYNGAYVSEFNSQQDSFSLANDFSLSQGLLTLCVDRLNDRITSSTNYDVTSRHNDGLFAQYATQIADLSIQTALRRDNNSQFGHANTGSIDLSWQFAPSLALTGGYGTGFHVPSFNYLYYPGYANPNLQPERSHTARLGLNWQGSNGWQSSLTSFRTRTQDLIASSASTNYVPYNINQAQSLGAEWQLGWKNADWVFNSSATWISAVDRSTGLSVPRQPKWSGRIDLDRQFGAWQAGMTLRGQTQTHESTASQINAGFVTMDVRLAYAWSQHWHLEASLNNMLDKRYQTAFDYNQAGRTVFLNLRYGL
ncbi:TonB-dependent receptor domain-containing protein [Halothiobacillus sp. DCM-1]|uniref:TonB-dependent receptor domain-containing protein n=1 Tax=Halothiobacillus sp. DCM-1 TaxID=3112558 RepID=UPI003253F428